MFLLKSTRKIPKRKIPKDLMFCALDLRTKSPRYGNALPKITNKQLHSKIPKTHIFLAIGLKSLTRYYDKKTLSQNDKKHLLLHPNLAKNKSFILSRALKSYVATLGFDKSNIFFCQSHKQNIAIIAFARFPIGVDIEIVRHRDFSAHIDFCFNDFERRLLSVATNPLREFYRIWTLKESLIKLENLTFGDLVAVGLDKKGAFVKKDGKQIYHTFITGFYKSQKAIITICY